MFDPLPQPSKRQKGCHLIKCIFFLGLHDKRDHSTWFINLLWLPRQSQRRINIIWYSILTTPHPHHHPHTNTHTHPSPKNSLGRNLITMHFLHVYIISGTLVLCLYHCISRFSLTCILAVFTPNTLFCQRHSLDKAFFRNKKHTKFTLSIQTDRPEQTE